MVTTKDWFRLLCFIWTCIINLAIFCDGDTQQDNYVDWGRTTRTKSTASPGPTVAGTSRQFNPGTVFVSTVIGVFGLLVLVVFVKYILECVGDERNIDIELEPMADEECLRIQGCQTQVQPARISDNDPENTAVSGLTEVSSVQVTQPVNRDTKPPDYETVVFGNNNDFSRVLQQQQALPSYAAWMRAHHLS